MRNLACGGWKGLNMKKAMVLLFAVATICLSALQVFGASSDVGETAEVQFASNSLDADSYQYFSNAMAQVSGPVKTYEYLRNNAEFQLYHGSRSGSINTFLSLRGNDVDLASALIAMYRYQGIHSRYVVGTIRVGSSQFMNWLGVKNLDLAVAIMKDQGIQNVALSSDRSTVDFEHVWVEALLPFGNYRGAGTEAQTVSCSTDPTKCHWISLDPSFKQKQYNDQGIDPYSALQFDYTNYYNAIKNANNNGDTSRLNKNPLEIYEEQILTWLQTNNPGKTLEDVAYTGNIIQLQNLILPASLPYTVVNTPRRYNSVADHDAVVPATEPKKWAKTLSVQFDMTVNLTGGGTFHLICGAGNKILLSDLATKRLTLTTEIVGGIPNVVVRLAGQEIARPLAGNGTISGYTPMYGDPFNLTVSMDGTPAATSSGTDETISATYKGCMVGGYYLLASGGETSNWTQVHRAAQQLLISNQNYRIVFNTSESGCQTDGTNCTPYVDINGTGVYASSDPRLLDDKPAMDDLTGGLLYVAAMQYYAKLHDDMEWVDALNHVKTPIAGYLGIVSATYEVEYIAGTAFSVLPGGLLIDMKGITITGSWRIDQPSTPSNYQFQLMGHIVSSLEHETWQELTGYDAVSTVRGIQMALANNATLLDLIRSTTTDTGQSMYTPMGYGSSPPSGFTFNRRSIYGTTMDSWSYPSSDSSQAYMVMEKKPTGTGDNHLSIYRRYNDYFDSNLACFYGVQNQLQSLENTYGPNAQLNAGALCISSFGTGTTIAQAISLNQSDYSYYYSGIAPDLCNYFDETKGFNTSNFVFRGVNGLSSSAQPTSSVWTWRNYLYLQDLTKGWNEYLVPSQMTTGPNYAFTVDIFKTYDTSNNLTSATFEIQNMTGLAAGGGYVPANGILVKQSTSISLAGTSNILPTFNNAVFTDKNTIGQTNNDLIKTPSTNDPASTVTGNNYHDETDFTI